MNENALATENEGDGAIDVYGSVDGDWILVRVTMRRRDAETADVDVLRAARDRLDRQIEASNG
jgi:hypothetical protein